MTYLLDTNAFSSLMKGDPTVVGRLRAIAKPNVSIPQPVLAEIAYGLARLPRSKRKAALTKRFTLLRDEIVHAPWTDDVSEHFGALKALLERRGTRLEDFDLAIAAHALSAGAVLVTADTDHLSVPGLVVENWSR